MGDPCPLHVSHVFPSVQRGVLESDVHNDQDLGYYPKIVLSVSSNSNAQTRCDLTWGGRDQKQLDVDGLNSAAVEVGFCPSTVTFLRHNVKKVCF